MKWIFTIAGLALFASSVCFGAADKNIAAVTVAGTGIFCLIFAFLLQFKKFSGLGIQAELWEQKQAEAAELVDQLRSLSALSTGQLLGIAARSRNMDAVISRRQLFELEEKTNLIVDDARAKPAEIKEHKADFYRCVAIEMLPPIIDPINLVIRDKAKEQVVLLTELGHASSPEDVRLREETKQKQSRFSDEQIKSNDFYDLSPDMTMYEALISQLESATCLSAQEVQDLKSRVSNELEDLRVWLVNRKIRRPSVWFV